jgi:integrase/recombinase XerC
MMADECLPVAVLPVVALDSLSVAARLLAAFLNGRKAGTIKSYRADLEDFRAFLQISTLDEAVSLLLASGLGQANALVLDYKALLLERQLAPSTINRRLAALRSLVKLARTLGLIHWKLEVEGMKSEVYKDTRGPGRAGFQKMLRVLDGRQDAKGIRDRAILRCLFDLGLRRAEVVQLDFEDLNRRAGILAVLGKGRSQKDLLTLPPETKDALEAWLVIRGEGAGPLFLSMNRARKGNSRLTGVGLYEIVRSLGAKAGLRVWPHGLRHAAITEALDLTGGNVRAVQKFSRHRDVRIIERYDDNRLDLAGQVARQVAASVSERPSAA